MQTNNLLPFIDIEKQCQTQHYGSLNLTLDVFQDRVVGIQGQQFQRVKFQAGQNTEVTALLLSEIKELFIKKENGMFTISLKFHGGDVREIYLQRNLKKQYPIEQNKP